MNSSDNQNNLGFFNFTTLWFGAAISVAEILAGGLLAPLGFKMGLGAIMLGHLIGTTLLVLAGIIGTEKRLPALATTRISFGQYGSYLFSVLNILQLLGWTAIMILSGARSVNQITKIIWSFDHPALWSVILGIFIFIWVALGKDRGWKKLNHIAVILLLLLTIVLSVIIFSSEQLFLSPVSGEMSFGAAMELAVVMPLSWIPLIADYTRYAKSKKAGAWGSWLGYFVGSSWMYIIGLGSAIVANDPDPSALLVSANLGIVALGIVVLATVTTTFLDAYSAGVSFANVFPKFNEKYIALAVTALGTVLAISLPMEDYEVFLYAIGSVFAPLFAILLTDYFILRKQSIDSSRPIEWSAIVVCGFGTFLYYQFINLDFILGATVPVMLITGVIFIMIRRVIKPWKSTKTLEKA